MSSPGETGATVDVDVDVAVVGAGPVGLVLAILLAQSDRSVVVLEQWPDPYPLPRAVHFDHEVGRILQSCRIGDEVRALSEPADVYEWRNGHGTTLLRFGRVGASMSGWPFSSMFCQPELEAVLRRRADALSVLEVRRGVRLRGVEQDDRAVTLHCAPVELGPDRRLVEHGVERGAPATSVRARYVVGCDGANSTVRDVLDVPVDDRGFFYDWLIVDVILDEPTVFDPPNLQVCDPARPTTAVSGGPGRRRWEFMRLPDETIEGLNDASRAWELLAPWGVHPATLASSGTPFTPSRRVPRHGGRSAGSSWRATLRTRCRLSLVRACAPGSVMPRTSPGSSILCSTDAPRPVSWRRTTGSVVRAPPQRSTSPWSWAR